MTQTTGSAIDAVRKLELQLMQFYPDTFITKYVTSPKHIHQYRSYLRLITYTDFSFSYLLDIILSAVRTGSRFRTLECLRVLKSIKRNASPTETQLPSSTVDGVFELYQFFIQHRNQDVQWAISVLLRGQVLKDWQLEWLIAGAHTNIHFVNRLLAYPERHPLLEQWAASAYEGNQHRDRLSELIGLLINDDIPEYVDEKNRSRLLWSIYRARIDHKKRKELLKKYWDLDSLGDLMAICQRLSYSDVLQDIHHELTVGKARMAPAN